MLFSFCDLRCSTVLALFTINYLNSSEFIRASLPLLMCRYEACCCQLIEFVVFQVPVYLYGRFHYCVCNSLAEPPVAVDVHQFHVASATSRSRHMTLRCCGVVIGRHVLALCHT